ncbi:hypothetical protein G7Y89_g13325 [Cudoniella acicularis]|uniref:Uncharacterized protein n=1 Tax=Cudoniella acicularis TaxID=354080 RepID=A0A8H4RA43_9HELO|nr:hypothetical protein G7Y89_g13325 [Cudoniella acicularis]
MSDGEKVWVNDTLDPEITWNPGNILARYSTYERFVSQGVIGAQDGFGIRRIGWKGPIWSGSSGELNGSYSGESERIMKLKFPSSDSMNGVPPAGGQVENTP